MTIVAHVSVDNQRPLPESSRPVGLACPACDAPVGERMRIAVESIRAASRRAAFPEMLMACSCGELFVVSLWPQVSALGSAAQR